MNILILNWRDTSHPKSGGAEIVTEEHAKAWIKKGHAVDLLTSSFPSANPLEIRDGIRVIRRGGEYSFYIFAAMYLLRNASSYDIIVDEIHGLPFFSLFVFHRPSVAFIHEIAGDIWDTVFPFPISSFGKWLEPRLLRLYNKKNIPFWTDSPSMVQELISIGISSDRCHAIPCPILRHYETKSEEKEKNPTYLFVSRIVPMKGVEEVVQAFFYIRKEEPHAQLFIVGSGEEKYIKKVKDIIKELSLEDSVTFFGRVSEDKKLRIMARSHILLHASMREGWGLVVLEAAKQGTPSVVYNVHGLRDVVKNGETGIVIQENSPEELAKQALFLLRNKKLYKTFQENGKRWVGSLRWEDVTEQSLALLEKTIQSFQR